MATVAAPPPGSSSANTARAAWQGGPGTSAAVAAVEKASGKAQGLEHLAVAAAGKAQGVHTASMPETDPPGTGQVTSFE